MLNVYGVVTCPEGYAEHTVFPGEGPVMLAVVHGAWIRELAESFDVVWASAWGADSALLHPILGLDSMPYVPMPAARFDARAKVPAIDAYAGGRPVVWIDDIVTAEAQQWAATRGAPTLLIETDPRIGLQRGHVEQALDWARQVSRPTAD